MTYFKLFFDCLELLEPLDDAERGRLITALLQYANSGEIPPLTGNERFVFPVFKRQLDHDQADYGEYAQRQRANGSKGGRPKTRSENPVVFSETQKTQDKDQGQEKEKDQDQPKDQDEDQAQAGAVAAAAWGERIGSPLSTRAQRELAQFARELGTECCLRAFDAALDAGKSNWAYVRGILRTKRDQGVRSPEDWDRLERQRERGKSGNGGPCQSVPERVRKNADWLEEFLAGQEKLDKLDK